MNNENNSLEFYKIEAERNAQLAQIHVNSIRYKLGSIIIDAIKNPQLLFLLPINAFKLYKEYNHKKYIQDKPIIVKKNDSVISEESNFEINNDSVDLLFENWKYYWKYSFLIQKIYDNNELDKKINCFMELKLKMLKDEYLYKPQEVLVSIIMPTYNRKNIIMKAINSVIKQTYKNWELIIIDDGSTDNTYEKVSTINDNRIRYIKNNRKKGVSGARNTGLLVAKGEYIAYLDTDNTWNDDYLLLMVNTLINNPDNNAVYCAQKIYRYNEYLKKDEFQYIRFAIYNHSLIKNKNYIDLNCYMHKKTLCDKFGGFSEELKRFVDWELIIRYSENGYPYALACVLSNYYLEKVTNQITSSDTSDYNIALEEFDRKIRGSFLKLKNLKDIDTAGYRLYSDNLKSRYKKSNKKVSIIIPNYEALNCLKVCIEAITKFTKNVEYEVIIVDNNSTEEVKKYLKAIKAEKNIKLILNEYNMGFTFAVNQGLKNSWIDSDKILLNNDAIVTENWLEELYMVKDNISDAGIIVPRQVLLPNTKTMNVHVPVGLFRRELDVSVSRHHSNILDVDRYAKWGFIELSFAPFFLVMITNECYKKNGLLDEKNGRHYKSDRLYCQKIYQNGMKIIYTPYSKAYHLLQQSTQILKKNNKQLFEAIFVKNDWSDLNRK